MMKETLDCMGEACPVPLIKTKKRMEEMAVDTILQISIDHSCAMKNIPDWANKIGYPVKVIETNPGEWLLEIQKKS